MLKHVRDVVFPWFRTLGVSGSSFERYMQSAEFKINKASLLVEAVNAIDTLRISEQNQDVQGDLYEYLLSKLNTAGRNGQFRTPRHIIRMMVKMLNPQPGERIGDLAAGTGGFLVGAYQHMLEQATPPAQLQYDEEGWPHGATGELLTDAQRAFLQEKAFRGYDNDSGMTMLRIGSMNLMLHGITSPRFFYADTLGKEFREANDYDVILMNPPFKGAVDKGDVSPTLPSTTTKSELLFLHLILRALDQGGRCAVIVPDGVLFGSSGAHVALRKLLVESHRLDGVVSMPGGVFKPYAGVSTAVLLFTRGATTGRIWYYDMEHDGFTLDDKRLPTAENDIADMLACWASRKDVDHLPPEIQPILTQIDQLNRLSDIPERVKRCREALTLVSRVTHLQLWAVLQAELANSLAQNPLGNRAENLELAIAAYQQALTVRTRETMPIEWAQTTMNLANAYQSRIRGDRAENLELAVAAYQQALTVQTREAMPDECRRTARVLGGIYDDLGRWREASTVYDQAVQSAEMLYLASASQFSKASELEANHNLHRRAAYALAQIGDRYRAVEIVEQGRARGLGETLDRDRSDLVSLRQTNSDQIERYLEATNALRRLEISERSDISSRVDDQLEMDRAARFVALTSQARSARATLDAAIEEIRTIPGYTGFLRPPAYDEISATVHPGGSLTYLIVTPQGSLALLIPFGGEPEALCLNDFTEQQLNDLLLTSEGDAVGGYLPGQLGDHQQLSTALDTALPLLGEQLIGPLAAQLRTMGAQGVTLIPTGLLSLLPLHAATYDVDGQTRCLLDEFDVAYTPSARVLATAQQEQQRRATGTLRLAGIGNPTRDLRYAGPELAAICDLLPTGASIAFYEEQARREALWYALPDATIAHLSCHGSFAADPLDSALNLACGDRLTLRDLIVGDTSALANLRLVVMSACQTALTDFQRVPDESIGLPGGFLQAGVPAVVGTLWSVDDLSTALLMHRFYELHLHGDSAAGMGPQPLAQALRMAQLWLRDLSYEDMYNYFTQHHELDQASQEQSLGTRMPSTLIEDGLLRAEKGEQKDPTARPFAHPFAWAAFTFSGAMEVSNGR